jgi:uncharacterized membrane protein HdeD (DUF308 family)
MSQHAASTPLGESPIAGVRRDAQEATGYWWLWLVAGIAWIAISVIILQFDAASVTTVGVLVGFLFAYAGIQCIALASVGWPGAEGESSAWRWVYGIFGVLFGISAVVCFISPEGTFVGMADTLGFLFLIVGIWWMVQAFMERAVNSLWWVGLISGILMTVLAFWTAGQFFIEKAYLLLVFAGIWALMAGITDIVRAFAIRDVHKQL